MTGVWNSINTNQADPSVGPWNELDYFASFSGNVGKFSGTLTYSPWNSPPHAFRTEHTADFKLAYDDTGMIAPGLRAQAVRRLLLLDLRRLDGHPRPHGEHRTTSSSASRRRYTLKAMTDYPVTFTLPGLLLGRPGELLGQRQRGRAGRQLRRLLGRGRTRRSRSAFIPARYGFWHADAGLQYFYLINDALLRAGTLASGNDNHNVLNASVGFGVNF